MTPHSCVSIEYPTAAFNVSSVGIYNCKGDEVDRITLPRPVSWIEGRISLDSHGIFYKGAGTRYRYHLYYRQDKKELDNPYGVEVINNNWVGKFGIFQTRRMPLFNEYVGACGPRELAIEENSKLFKLSDVIFIDRIDYDKTDKQSYYLLKYKDNRVKFLSGGKVKNLLSLMEYVLSEDWNFPWDKGSLSDITLSGRVSDVADLFRSSLFVHKFGTVFSLVGQLQYCSLNQYFELKKILGIGHGDAEHKLIFPVLGLPYSEDVLDVTMEVIKHFGGDISGVPEDHLALILEQLIPGHNCGCGEDDNYGEKVRDFYRNKLNKLVKSTPQ